jgi:hypothetical protein
MRHLLIEHFQEDGQELLRIPLNGSDRHAVISQDDFDMLMILGVSPIWSLIGEGITTRNQMKTLSVSRLLKDAGKNEHVKFLDSDPTNLRQDNMIITNGSSKYRTREQFVPEFPRRRYQLKHVRIQNI